MRRLLSPPAIEDGEQSRVARLMHYSLWGLMLVTAVFTALAVFTGINTARFLLLGPTGIFISAVLLVLLHRGWVRWTSGLIVFATWAITTAAIYSAGGVRAAMYMAYIVIIFLTGLLRGGRAGTAITVLCSLSGLWLVWLETTGQLPPSASLRTPLSIWFTSLVFFWAVALLQYLSSSAVREAMGRAARELTERKNAESALRESEDLYRRAITAAGAVPYYQDYATDRYTFMGEGIQQLTGYTTAELTPRLLSSLIEEQQLYGEAAKYGSVQEAVEHARRGEFRIWRADLRIRTRSGERRWIADSSVEVLGDDGLSKSSVGILEDITARKETEMAAAAEAIEVNKLYRASARLLEGANELRGLAQQIADSVVEEFALPECGVWMIREDGQALTRLAYAGYAHDYVPFDIPLDGPGLMTAAARQGEVIYVPDVRLDPRYLKGDDRTQSELVIPMLARHKVIGVLNIESPTLDGLSEYDRRLVSVYAERAALALDNTRLVISLEQAVRRANEFAGTADEASRIKSQFLTNTSHELRTPLTSIIGALDILMNDLHQTKAEEKQLLKTALEASQSLATTLDDLLEIAKIEAGRIEIQPQITALGPILDEAYAIHRSMAEQKGIALRLDAPVEDTLLYADPDRLRRIILNLIGNAVKFTDTGSVTVYIRADREARQMTITVEDTGIGVPSEIQRKLFEPFVQADGSTTRRFGGTGLGLSISRRLAEMMGGTLSLYSAGDGRGTALILRLPLAEPESR